MASKTYTAQEMREMADKEKFKCSFVTRTLNGGIILDCTNDVRAMLRQAADALEREKKYETSIRYAGRNRYATFIREVGEWKEVKNEK